MVENQATLGILLFYTTLIFHVKSYHGIEADIGILRTVVVWNNVFPFNA